MNPIPELIPFSELRQRRSDVLKEIGRAPVVLTQYGRALAVLVNPAQWNELVSELEDLRDALDAAEARQDDAPLMNFDEYLIQRGDVVPAPAD